jgi:hypothetical protein
VPRRSEIASWAGFALRVTASGIWLFSGAAKLPQIAGFPALVERYGILPHVLAVPFGYLLPFVELGIGLYLLVGLFVRGTAIAGTLLFIAFLAAQIQALARGLTLDCGCFGPIAQSTVGPLTILRDAALGIPTFLMVALPSRRLSVDGRLFGDKHAPGSHRAASRAR